MMKKSLSLATLSQFQMDKCQVWILIVNIHLCVLGFGQLLFGTILCTFYHLDKLYYIYDGWLYNFPMGTIGVGVLLIIIASLGIVMVLVQSRKGIIVFCIFTVLLIIPQLFTLYMSTKVEHALREGLEEEQHAVREILLDAFRTNSTYPNRDRVVSTWNHIQEYYGCCGVIEETIGYDFWNDPAFQLADKSYRLPASCCIKCRDCKCESVIKGFFLLQSQEKAKKAVYRTGCIKIMDMVFKRELIVLVDPGFVIWAVASTVLEFSSLLIAIVYFNILTKRAKRRRERLARENELNDLRVSQMRDLGRIDELPEPQ